MPDRHIFEDSVCLGFKTFTDAYKEAGERGTKAKGLKMSAP